MSANTKVEKFPLQIETKAAPTRPPADVPFPSVKDLKAKFSAGGDVNHKEIVISKKEQQIRHSYARGNSRLEITGPEEGSSRTKFGGVTNGKQQPPTTLKVKTSSSAIFPASQSNGSSPATTPTSPSYQSPKRTSLIVHMEKGKLQNTTDTETVQLRKRISIAEGNDNVRRLTSQFADKRQSDGAAANVTSAPPPLRSNRLENWNSQVTETVVKESVVEKYEEEKYTYEEEKHEYEEEKHTYEEEEDERSSLQEETRERRMSTPTPQFLQSMNDDQVVTEREEFDFGNNQHEQAAKDEEDYSNAYNYQNNEEEEREEERRDNEEEYHHQPQELYERVEENVVHDNDDTVYENFEYRDNQEDSTDYNKPNDEEDSTFYYNKPDEESNEMGDNHVTNDVVDDVVEHIEERVEEIEERIEERLEDDVAEKVEERLEEEVEERIEEKVEEIEERVEEAVDEE